MTCLYDKGFTISGARNQLSEALSTPSSAAPHRRCRAGEPMGMEELRIELLRLRDSLTASESLPQ